MALFFATKLRSGGITRRMFDLFVHAEVARLTLRRPEARNAIPATGWAELASLLAQVEARGARLLLVLGEGEAFCAGADVKDFAAMRGDAAARTRFRTAMRSACDGLAALPVPTIAAIDGACFGAGVALAMACDLRLAGPKARFAITPAKFGISYPQADIARLVSLVGLGQASLLLLGGQVIDGQQAARIGLVERHVPDDLWRSVDDLVAAILANSEASLAELKQGIGLAARGIAADEDRDIAFDALLGSDELVERLAARRERSGR